jgi:hypothetical protein
VPEDVVLRLAMWSGPRNISTALMRSWGNRSDTAVWDEPLYAHYLLEHGLEHPGREEVLQHHESDVEAVVARLTGPVSEAKRIFYQKHMAHHLLPEMDREWIFALTNCFLIREPREMLTSLLRVLPRAELFDTGLAQQVEIFDEVRRRSGEVPPVLDAKDVLDDPPRLLRLLCERLGMPFDEAMLEWPPGPRTSDGVWAKHWYGAVECSTTFRPYRPKPDEVQAEKRDLLEECEHLYDELASHRLR